MSRTLEGLSVADEVWVATALLHRENPERADFTLSEIVARAEREGAVQKHRPGLRPHASRHCVANAPPSPARHRMLFETGKSTRRLYRAGDPVHPKRRTGKQMPDLLELPEKYRHLIAWYSEEYSPAAQTDPLLELYGTWKSLLEGRSADDHVRELREGWE